MSAFYLYAITDRPGASVPAQSGLEEAALFGIDYRGIAAVVSPFTAAAAAPTEANLWRHEAIVEALMADRAILPVRFGTLLASEAAVRATLTAHYADFVAGLERVRGRVECGLRVLWDNDQRPMTNDRRPPESGRVYMLARLEEDHRLQAWQAQAEALAMELDAPLARLAVESVYRTLSTPRLLLTATYLVERDRVAAFRLGVEALKATYPALHFLCTGPWPPYSFVATTVPMIGGEDGSNVHV